MDVSTDGMANIAIENVITERMGKTAQTNVVIANNNRAIIQMVPVYPDVPLVVIKEKRAKKR